MWFLISIILFLIVIILRKRMKHRRFIVVLSVYIAIWFLGGVLSFWIYFCKAPIGIISGLEDFYITIDGVVYELDDMSGYSSSDRYRYMGRVETEDGDRQFHVYSVKGTDEYIYRLWDWEEAFYQRVED